MRKIYISNFGHFLNLCILEEIVSWIKLLILCEFFQNPDHKKSAKRGLDSEANSAASDSGDTMSDQTDEYENGEWETLKEREKQDKADRHRNMRKKYYYDWGDQFVGMFLFCFCNSILWSTFVALKSKSVFSVNVRGDN